MNTNTLSFHLNASLPDHISSALSASGLLRKKDAWANMPNFHRNHFYPDGTPINPLPNTVYPATLHHYVRIPIPALLEDIPPMYSRSAADAALSWLNKVSGNKKPTHWTFNGLSFQTTIMGVPLNICFPDTTIIMSNGFQDELYAVMALADTETNDEDWENGKIPMYVTAQAQFLLWCHKQYAIQHPAFEPAQKVRIVRIKGNVSGEILIRSAAFDYGVAMRHVNKLAVAIGAMQTSSDLSKNYTLIPHEPWWEKKKNKLDIAYRLEDPDLYALIRSYMAAKSERKQLEEQSKIIHNEVQSIAVQLAALTDPASLSGALESNGYTYTVNHTKTNSAKAPTISAEILLQFCPQYHDAVNTTVHEGGSVKIEAVCL